MIAYSNPRLEASFDNWPSGRHQVNCKFTVEDGGKKGQRVLRQTTDKHGRWCKPKADTYKLKAAIVDGDDGRTYILSASRYGFLHVSRHDFMDQESVFERDVERYNELKALLSQV